MDVRIYFDYANGSDGNGTFIHVNRPSESSCIRYAMAAADEENNQLPDNPVVAIHLYRDGDDKPMKIIHLR